MSDKRHTENSRRCLLRFPVTAFFFLHWEKGRWFWGADVPATGGQARDTPAQHLRWSAYVGEGSSDFRVQVPSDTITAKFPAQQTLLEHAARLAAGPPRAPPVDRNYQALRIGMHTLFRDLGIQTHPAAA